MAKIITVTPTPDQIHRATIREQEMTAKIIAKYGRDHLNNSIKEGEGVLVGLLGEEVIKDFYSFTPADPDDLYDFDLYDPAYLRRIDVKTKLQKYDGAPRGHYNATVCDANTLQYCDYYVFVRVRASLKTAWILGALPKRFFLARAKFYRAGEIDPTSQNGWRFAWDCHNVAVRHLWSLPEDPAELQLLVEKEKHFKLRAA